MALSDLKRGLKPDRKPNLVVDLSAFMPDKSAAEITFREPTGADLFKALQVPSVKEKTKYPDYDDEQLKTIRLMALCFVPSDADQGKYNVFETLADLVNDNPLMYLYIHGTFMSTYQLDVSYLAEQVPNV